MKSKTIAIRLILVAAALTTWFWTQSLIGKRAPASEGIQDQVHVMTAPINAALTNNRTLTSGTLIVSSLFIDALGIFLLAWGIFGPSFRPVAGLLAIFGLRQLCQFATALPAPPNMLWYDPGFPSLLVTYGVSTDLFFSGHTAIAVFGATELARFKKTWLTLTAVFIALFEIVVVLLLRAHYTLDVFTGVAVALLVASILDQYCKRKSA